MTEQELIEKLKLIQRTKHETRTLELKSAHTDCPRRLYDTLSSFSNQDDGGIIVFGVDEENNYEEVGIYDPQDIQKRINEQCQQMEPIVRPLITTAEKDGKFFASAEIPGANLTDRPCYYKGKGRLKGSYVRVGDSDEPMTEYEVYSYEAYRRKYQDDIRIVDRATQDSLDTSLLEQYLERLQSEKPHLASLPRHTILELMSITRNDQITLSSVLLFSPYPQAYFPQLCIIATVIPGTEIGEIGREGERFLDNQRMEGNISDMLNASLQFVKKNMRRKTIVNARTGEREDRTDYPITAVREALLNALVHRDYSIYTEGKPIQLIMYSDRLEIRSPGGIYGRITADQLGKVQPDTRNPVLAAALETLNITENRYSGIPTIQREMKSYHLPPAEFADERGSFIVRFYKNSRISETKNELTEAERDLILFCETPRTRREISEHLGISSSTYAIQRYVMPLVSAGLIFLSLPDKPQSPKQRYGSVHPNSD